MQAYTRRRCIGFQRWTEMIKFFRSTQKEFRTRSTDRDRASDRSILAPVGVAIEHALANLQSQQDGLERRIRDATDCAAFTAGNDVYENKTREQGRTDTLRKFETELANARIRKTIVAKNIADLRSVRALFLSLFPKAE